MINTELLHGTLEMLILKTLTWGPMHGFGIGRWIEQLGGEDWRIEEGSLYPALYRLERKGWIEADWGQREEPAREILSAHEGRTSRAAEGNDRVDRFHSRGGAHPQRHGTAGLIDHEFRVSDLAEVSPIPAAQRRRRRGRGISLSHGGTDRRPGVSRCGSENGA
jgi:hypothetical protein